LKSRPHKMTKVPFPTLSSQTDWWTLLRYIILQTCSTRMRAPGTFYTCDCAACRPFLRVALPEALGLLRDAPGRWILDAGADATRSGAAARRPGPGPGPGRRDPRGAQPALPRAGPRPGGGAALGAAGAGGRPWGRSGSGRAAVATDARRRRRRRRRQETHPCPHGQSQRPALMRSRLGGVGVRP
jgi:hypothetical protein